MLTLLIRMAARKQYLIRRVGDGTCRTVTAPSTRAAMKAFLISYRPGKNESFEVKERGAGEWESYKVT